MQILSIFGTRPEAIKMAPILKRLAQDPRFRSRICVTGQHRQMLDQVLSLFGITPDIDLEIMRPGQDLFDITSRTLVRLRDVISTQKPDLILVQGDTSTCFVASLAAFYLDVPVGHVEAGLRTGDIKAPFPEEANRQMTSRLAALHFAPTKRARDNLLAEGIPSHRIHVTGNTVIDALLTVKDNLKEDHLTGAFGSARSVIEAQLPYVLVTGHRRENFGPGFREICRAIARLAENRPELHFIYPVHLNPNVQKPVREILAGRENIHLIPPLDYRPFVLAMDRARLILTDSGGVQEEAPSLGKPVLVMRETTERPEAVSAGTVILVGTNQEKIIAQVERLLDDPAHYQRMAARHNPYGDGRAAERIIAVLSGKTMPKDAPE